MKELDELIKDYKFYGDERVSCETVLQHLEALKQSIKEQHKKDVVKTYIDLMPYDKEIVKELAKQYYNDNF